MCIGVNRWSFEKSPNVVLTKIQNFIEIQSSRFRWYSFVFARTQSRLVLTTFFGPFLLFLLFNYFFMQFLLFNYFFTEIHFFFIRGPKIGDFASKKFPLRASFFSPIFCENCPLHFNYFFKVFQILLYISVCHLVIIHFGGYFFFAGEYIFCLYDVRIPIFSYFLTTFLCGVNHRPVTV